MTAEIIQLYPTPEPPCLLDADGSELYDRLVGEVAHLQLVQQRAAEFVAHVQEHKAKGWHKVPMRSCCDGQTGFELLVEALEGDR